MTFPDDAPVEVTTRYATCVATLAEAWTFVMERLDRVGPWPSVQISSRSSINVIDAMEGTEDSWTRYFEVVVSGQIHEKDDRQPEEIP